MTPAVFLTYTILLFILIICFSNPRFAFLLLLATQFTRITIPLGFPRIASPLLFEMILLIIIYLRLTKKYSLAKIIQNSKLIVLWAFLHIGFRIVQTLIYNDISNVSGDIINFYGKILFFYLILINIFSDKNDFSLLIKFLQINALFTILFIYSEYLFSVTYSQLFSIDLRSAGEFYSTRYGQDLIRGPYQHWTTSGMFIVTCLPLFIVNNNNLNIKNIFMIFFLIFTIIIIGSRAAIVSVFIISLILVIINLNIKNLFSIIILILGIPVVLVFMYSVVDLLRDSFVFTMDTNSAGYNLSYRLLVTALLISNIFNVPFFGYGYRLRPMGPGIITSFPISTADMESNIFIKDIYDFGLVSGIITIIWILNSTLFSLKQQKNYNYASFLSWLGFLIAALSNITFTFPMLLVPICFFAWEKWKLLENKSNNLVGQD